MRSREDRAGPTSQIAMSVKIIESTTTIVVSIVLRYSIDYIITFSWGDYWELNPDKELHKLVCYRYTIATIYYISKYPKERICIE